MKKRQHDRWYRRPRSIGEARANCDCEYARAKRRPVNLPDSWDDRPIRVNRDKSWKHKRKTQYRGNKRGERHELVTDNSIFEYDFKEYCEQHDIPHKVENLYESYIYRHYLSDYRWAKCMRYRHNFVTGKYEYMLVWDYTWVPNGKYEDRKHTRLIGYKLIWWSDKDIGIDYILNRSRIWK